MALSPLTWRCGREDGVLSVPDLYCFLEMYLRGASLAYGVTSPSSLASFP